MSSLYANLNKASPRVLSLPRIVVALLFLANGTQKFFGFPSAGPSLTPLLTAQAVIEFVGGILLVLGVYTRAVAFILSGDMEVAQFMVHFPKSFLPSANGGDAAVLFCFIFFYLIFAGGGAWSIDRAFLKQDQCMIRKKPALGLDPGWKPVFRTNEQIDLDPFPFDRIKVQAKASSHIAGRAAAGRADIAGPTFSP